MENRINEDLQDLKVELDAYDTFILLNGWDDEVIDLRQEVLQEIQTLTKKRIYDI
jgi:hypothetical protein